MWFKFFSGFVELAIIFFYIVYRFKLVFLKYPPYKSHKYYSYVYFHRKIPHGSTPANNDRCFYGFSLFRLCVMFIYFNEWCAVDGRTPN